MKVRTEVMIAASARPANCSGPGSGVLRQLLDRLAGAGSVHRVEEFVHLGQAPHDPPGLHLFESEHPVGTTDPATLVAPGVMNRLAQRVTVDHPGIDEATARRIVGQAAAFAAASGRQAATMLVPSRMVDIGWHACILHTAIRAAGYAVDIELWDAAADCSQCHSGWHDSPKSG